MERYNAMRDVIFVNLEHYQIYSLDVTYDIKTVEFIPTRAVGITA